LLINSAKKARFMPLKSIEKSAKQAQLGCNKHLQALPNNIDVLLLGMGDDGHTASFFPCLDHCILSKMLDPNNTLRAMAVQPKSAPYERMSLTAGYLLKSENIYLLLKGKSKLKTYEQALASDNVMAMPIRIFIGHHHHVLNVYYSAL